MISTEHTPGPDTAPVGLTMAHPLARVAREQCRKVHGPSAAANGPARVACGRCWEDAIRRDERVVIAFGLDRGEVGDPDYLDPIAVSLACAGEPVRLTRAERRAARAQLAAAGLGPTEIGRRLSRRGTAARPPLTASDTDRAAA